MATHRVAIDLASVVEDDHKTLVTVLAWGHPVTVVDDSGQDWVGIKMREGTRWVRRRTKKGGHAVLVPLNALNLLKIDFADVQQGDGALIEDADRQAADRRRRRDAHVRPLCRCAPAARRQRGAGARSTRSSSPTATPITSKG